LTASVDSASTSILDVGGVAELDQGLGGGDGTALSW
jgi:hypothetical protein